MPRSRPASNPLSFHKSTGQYYVTRQGKRVYLGADKDAALAKYHRLALGLAPLEVPQAPPVLTARELCNRFIAAQQANWADPGATLRSYKDWLGRFLRDHRSLMAEEMTVEVFAAWKMSLRERGYAPESINHYLSAVRAVYRFAEDAELLRSIPRLRRVRNEPRRPANGGRKALYGVAETKTLLDHADVQVRVMILLGLNCGFGPKDIQDIRWQHIDGDRATLARSKTGVQQTFLLWPETKEALASLRLERNRLLARLAKRGTRPRF